MASFTLQNRKYLTSVSKNLFLVKLLLLSAFFIIAFSAHSQSLSKKEKKILKNVEMGMNATIDLLKESVNINSGTFNVSGVRKTGEVYARELATMGFTVEWVSLPDSLKRAGHLVAYRKGKKGKKVLLIGHLDTVFEPDMPAG